MLGLRVLFLVLHAPSDDDDQTLQQFWRATTAALPIVYQSWDMVVLTDSNSRVGSVPSDAVGDHHSDTENVKGEFFHDWLLHLSLYTCPKPSQVVIPAQV